MSRTLERAEAFFATLDALIGPRTPTQPNPETGEITNAHLRKLQEPSPERR